MAREKALERKRTAATTTATATRGISSATASASLPSSSEKSGSHVARQLGLMAVWAAVGLLSTRAGVYGGLAPFGVGVAAAVQGAMSPVVYAATLLGYLLPGVTSPFRYVAAVCAVAGIRWALSGFRKAARDRRFAPIAAFVATAATGVALQMMNGLSGAVLVLLLSESLLAGGFAYFAAVSFGILSQDKIELPLAASDQASLLAVGAVLLMAVSRFTVGGLVPGHVLAVLIILTLARTGKEQSGSVAGIVIGLCMTIMSGGQLYLAAAYGFGGLAAGLFSRFGRFASAGAFVAANTVVAMAAGGDGAVVAGLYEVAAATILAVLTPSAVDRRINAFFAGAQEKPAVEGLRHAVVQRLTGAAASMREVASTVGAVSQRLEEGRGADSGCVYRGVSDKICRRCGLKMQCWERSFDNTMDSFNHLTPLLKAKGQIEVGDVNGHLARHCCHIEEVVACVNTDWREWLINESAWRRLTEIRSVITDQFVGTGDLLQGMADDFGHARRVDADTALRVQRVCESFGVGVLETVCFVDGNGHISIDISAENSGFKWRGMDFHAAVEQACGRALNCTSVSKEENREQVRFAEKPPYRLQVGTAQLRCDGERLCGDALQTLSDHDKLTVVLSDGMGTGGRAAVDGAMTAALTTSLLRAGFQPDSILRTVNAALLVKAGDESLATLDIASVNLFDGRVSTFKAGAATTLLRSHGRVSRMERDSLPVGIVREVEFEHTSDTLDEGDVLLLFSDGLSMNGLGWVEEELRAYDETRVNVAEFADMLAKKARREHQVGRQDDISVAAMRLMRNSA